MRRTPPTAFRSSSASTSRAPRPPPRYGSTARSADALLRLATGVASALAAIHSADVVHRDLKPGNVLLGPDGPRIIDVGIARAADMSLTASGAIMGTLGHIAPEVLAGKRATEASDIFAWAAVMVYAAGAVEPFRGDHIGEVVHRTASLDPDLSAIPARIRPLVAAALAKNPDIRPNANDLLLGLVGSLPASADPRRALLEAGARRAASPDQVPDRRATGPATQAVPPLGDLAEAAFGALPGAAQLAAQEILLRLVAPGDAPDGSQDSVRTAGRGELHADRPESERRTVRQALEALCEAGVLVRAEDGSVRPVSAALVPAWRRLREWVATERAGLTVHRRLGRAALAWQAHGERADDLLHGTTLRTSLDWLATAPFALRPSPLELRFLTASRTAATRAARRRRQLLSGPAVPTVLALLAGTFAWFQREESRRRGEEADLRRAQATARSVAQAADSLRGTAPDTALLLGLASWRLAHTAESRAALNTAATQRETSVITLPVPANAPENGTVLLDRGRTMMIYTTERATFWDLTKGQKGADEPRLTLPGLASMTPYTPHVVSQDGRLLVLPGRTEGAPYRRVSTRDGSSVGKPVPLQPGFVPAQVSNEGHVLFSDDVNGLGSRRHRLLSPSRATTAQWTGGVATLSPLGTHYASCGGDAPGGGAVSPDGRVGVFRKGEEQPVQHLVDLRTGKETAAPVPQRMAGVAPSVNRFSALFTGGRVLAFTDHRPRGDELGLAVSVWDTRAHEELFRASVPEGKEVFHLALSPDGRHVAVSYDFRAEPSGEG